LARPVASGAEARCRPYTGLTIEPRSTTSKSCRSVQIVSSRGRYGRTSDDLDVATDVATPRRRPRAPVLNRCGAPHFRFLHGKQQRVGSREIVEHERSQATLDSVARRSLRFMTSGSATAGPFCGNCNTKRSPEVAAADPRPPCPKCGATELSYHVSVWETVSVTDSISATLTPGDQDRGWQRRWLEVQRVQAQLSAEPTGGMSADAMHQAVQDFMSFFGLAYHLKDALKAASPQGLHGSAVESAISKTRHSRSSQTLRILTSTLC